MPELEFVSLADRSPQIGTYMKKLARTWRLSVITVPARSRWTDKRVRRPPTRSRAPLASCSRRSRARSCPAGSLVRARVDSRRAAPGC
eukprot:281817-Chlamydomonas_euryale.AAC.2